jgi:hypothetical protein
VIDSNPPAQLIDDLLTIRSWAMPPQGPEQAEVDSINVIIGDGANPIVAGVAAAIRVDFRCVVSGCFLQEFDGVTGSITLTVQRAQGGAAPTWVQISPTTPAMAIPTITSGRYFADNNAIHWTGQPLARGDYLRFVVASAATITRVHVALRIRRLEP